MTSRKTGRDPSPHVWVSSTYFAEGFPYTIVNNVAEVMFEQLGASLQAIGLTSLFHLPWNLKFLWGPFLDHYESKRRWLVVLEVVISLVVFALSFFVGLGTWFVAVAVAFLTLGFLSATHDIAIDGYYLEALDEKGQAAFVGHRAMAYKIAGLVLGGPLLFVISRTSWSFGLALAGLVMTLVTAFHVFVLPAVEARKLPISVLVMRAIRLPVLATFALLASLIVYERRWLVLTPKFTALWTLVGGDLLLATVGIEGLILLGLLVATVIGIVAVRLSNLRKTATSQYAKSFITFFAQPGIGRVLAFVILYRTGESFLLKMRWPFLHKVLGMDLGYYGIVNGTIGVAASFVATMVGGHLIARDGLRRWIWPFMLAQNTLNLLYVLLALVPGAPSAVVAFVIGIEHVGAGLGTAVLMVYLMRACDPAHKAGHFAIVSAFMSISFTLAGVCSGFLAAAWGFPLYFAFTFAATVPAMVLVFFVPHLDGAERRATEVVEEPAP